MAAAAIVGLLAMHGFESTLMHDGHAGPDGHVHTSTPSAAENQILAGPCSLHEPSPAPVPKAPICVVRSLLARSASDVFVEFLVPRISNRAVLTAFSVLRL